MKKDKGPTVERPRDLLSSIAKENVKVPEDQVSVGVGSVKLEVGPGDGKDHDDPNAIENSETGNDAEHALSEVPEPVDVALLFDEIYGILQRHLFLPSHAAEALTLWIVVSHAHDAFGHSPRFAITAPMENCGKSTVLKVLARLCPNPRLASNYSPASLFRLIDKEAPTILIDEFDTYHVPDYVGLLNSGHDRETATIVRCEQDASNNYTTTEFRTWAPMAIAMIGTIEPAQLRSRCIVICMQRAKPNERPQPLPAPDDPMWEDLRGRLARCAKQSLTTLRDATPSTEGLDNRAADNWRPLFAIADLAGGKWPGAARRAAAGLSEAPQQSPTEELLAAIRRAFADKDALTAEGLSRALADDAEFEGAAAYGHLGNPKAAGRALNKALKPIFIQSRSWGDGKGGSWRGFKKEQFEDAWERYLKK